MSAHQIMQAAADEVTEARETIETWLRLRYRLSRHDAEDCAAQAGLALLERAGAVDPDRLGAYYRISARNAAVSLIRSRARRPAHETLDARSPDGPTIDETEALDGRCDASQVYPAILALLESEPHGGEFRRVYELGEASHEVADEMGMPHATHRQRMYRVRARIRASLGPACRVRSLS